ncbi:hypothetical protein D3C72_1441130 [compost metagenome]
MKLIWTIMPICFGAVWSCSKQLTSLTIYSVQSRLRMICSTCSGKMKKADSISVDMTGKSCSRVRKKFMMVPFLLETP